MRAVLRTLDRDGEARLAEAGRPWLVAAGRSVHNTWMRSMHVCSPAEVAG